MFVRNQHSSQCERIMRDFVYARLFDFSILRCLCFSSFDSIISRVIQRSLSNELAWEPNWNHSYRFCAMICDKWWCRDILFMPSNVKERDRERERSDCFAENAWKYRPAISFYYRLSISIRNLSGRNHFTGCVYADCSNVVLLIAGLYISWKTFR